jgi:hypothetical protein
MAVTPDPVGAYNQSFQTADTSRRDYERLELQRQQQAEAAVQRAREQKANDFKMMMEALGRRDDLKQQAIDNQFKKEQLANQTMTAEAAAYRARNPTSRSGQGMLNISPPGFAQPAIPGDGTTPSAVPPVGDINASGPPSYGAEGDLPMTDGQGNQPNLLLPQILPPTAASGTPPDLLPGELMPPPQAPTDNTPPAAPAVPPAVPAPTEPQYAAFPQPIGDLIPSTAPVAPSPTATPSAAAPTQPIPQPPAASTTVPAVSVPRRNDLMGYMLNRTDPYTDKIGIPRVAQMPEVPVFGQADIATGGRDQLKQLASVIETAQMARAQAPRNIDDARSLINSGKLVPARVAEWTNYIKQQDRVAAASASIEGEAAQQLLEAKENIKGIESRQGALNRLGNLNGVLPIGDRRQIYQEASDPGMAQLAEQKIAVLTEYDAFRQLNGITNASRGYRTAEQVVRAKRELDSKEAEADRKLAENSQAYQAAIKARPDMDEKAKAELELEIGKANPAQIRQNERVTRLNNALEADRLPPRPPATAEAVKPEDIRVNPVTGTAAAATDKTYRISQPMNPYQQQAAENKAGSDAVWGALKRQAAPVVTEMDIGTLQDIVNGVTKEPFSRAQSLTAPGRFDVVGVSPPSGTRISKLLADTELKDLKLPSGYDRPEFTGRSTPLTAEDALIAAARDELRRRNPNAANAATPQVSASGKAMAAKVLPAAEGN